jgi:Flp pilus assembly protein TadG
VRGLRNFLLLHRDQSGQVAVIVALLMVPLLAFMAVAIDLGVLRYEKRQMQTVADAAAIGGALEYPYGATAVTNGAQAAALLNNSFTNGSNGATLTVTSPPADGPHAGISGCVEAIASQSQGTYFANILGITSMTATARAVACQTSSPACVYTLSGNPTGISQTGSGSLNAQCGILDNSNINNTGSGSITATSVGVVSGYTNTGSGSISPTPQTIIPQSDPLLSLQSEEPTVPTGCTYTNLSNTGSTSVILSPGTYCGGYSNTGSGNITFSPGNYAFTNGGISNTGSGSMKFGSGLYIISGGTGLQLTGSGALTGSGVTFYITGTGGVDVTGSSNITLTAPTSGTYAGILIFQNQNDSAPVTVTGSSTSKIEGTLYLPDASIQYTGSNSTAAYSIIVAKSITITGSGTTNVTSNYAALPGGLSPIETAVLVE